MITAITNEIRDDFLNYIIDMHNVTYEDLMNCVDKYGTYFEVLQKNMYKTDIEPYPRYSMGLIGMFAFEAAPPARLKLMSIFARDFNMNFENKIKDDLLNKDVQELLEHDEIIMLLTACMHNSKLYCTASNFYNIINYQYKDVIAKLNEADKKETDKVTEETEAQQFLEGVNIEELFKLYPEYENENKKNVNVTDIDKIILLKKLKKTRSSTPYKGKLVASDRRTPRIAVQDETYLSNENNYYYPTAASGIDPATLITKDNYKLNNGLIVKVEIRRFNDEIQAMCTFKTDTTELLFNRLICTVKTKSDGIEYPLILEKDKMDIDTNSDDDKEEYTVMIKSNSIKMDYMSGIKIVNFKSDDK